MDRKADVAPQSKQAAPSFRRGLGDLSDVFMKEAGSW
jgi:hypothetical protein